MLNNAVVNEKKCCLSVTMSSTKYFNPLILLDTTDSTAISTGSLQVAGGISLGKNLFTNLSITVPSSTNQGYFFGTTATNGLSQIGTAAQYFTNSTIGDITLRNTAGNIRLGISNGVSNLDLITSTGNVVVNTTTDSSSIITGAFQVKGGASIAKTLWLGGGSLTNGGTLNIGYSAVSYQIYLYGSGSSTVYQNLIDTQTSGNLRLFSKASINLDSTTAINIAGSTPCIQFNNGGLGTPTFNSRSAGSRLVLWQGVSSTAAEYAIGMSSYLLWFSTPDTNSNFQWFGGTQMNMSLYGNGKLYLPNCGTNGLYQVSTANTSQASSDINAYPNATIFGPAVWGSTLFFYWKDPGGTKYYVGIGTSGGFFTGQHMNYFDDGSDPDKWLRKLLVGKIVVSQGRYGSATLDGKKILGKDAIKINEALPFVSLAQKDKDMAVFGVVTDSRNENNTDTDGNIVYDYNDRDDDFNRQIFERIRINSVGEGAIWVCNVNGSFKNGEYITTTSVLPGYGVRQDDDILHNYTVAKITCDCNFDLDSDVYVCEEMALDDENTALVAFVGCTYHCG